MKRVRILVTLLFLPILAVSALSADGRSRPEYYGRSLPYLIYSPLHVYWPGSLTAGKEEIVPLNLRITELGQVDSVALIEALPARLHKPVLDIIDSLRFEPGIIDGNVATCNLRINLALHGGDSPPSFIFPVDSTGKIGQPGAYFESIALNGVSLPRLVDFPRFACYFNPGDSTGVVPTAVVAIDLDSTGAVAERSMLMSNRQLPDDQLLSATLWSRFEPAVVDGIPRPSRVYLTVSCFRLLNYPNYPMAPSRDTVRSFFREYQIQLFQDTLGWLLPAIPRFDVSKDVVVHARGSGLRGSFSIRLHIDTSGDARAVGMNPHSAQHREFVARLMKELKFYPAIDFHGRVIPFTGLTHVDLSAAPKVRIEYFW